MIIWFSSLYMRKRG